MNRHLRYMGAVGGVGVVYWIAAKAGLQLAYLHGSVAALWPPVGVGMAALILYGISLWPGIVLGDLAVADFSQPAGTVIGQTIGNTLEVLIAALLFYRLAEGRTQFGRVRDVGASGRSSGSRNGCQRGLRSGIAGARRSDPQRRGGGGLADVVSGRPLRRARVRSFRAVLGRREDPRDHVASGIGTPGCGNADRRARAASLTAGRAVRRVPRPDLGGASLGSRGAAGAVALVTTLTVFNTAHHAGPFVRATITQSLLATQLFVASAALTSLVLGAVIEERHAALDALRQKEQRLRTSRARIVKAGDAARRRLERNLHDGAQQRLVSLALTLRLARLQLANNPTEAEHLMTEASEELQLAIDELRELARGIHPAVLSDRGLGPALEVLADHAHFPVALEADIPARLPPPVEAAVYYVAAEGLTNIAKYAHATSASVRLDARNHTAVLRVGDDGASGADPSRGTGLRGLADRIEALGGKLELYSPPGHGTVLTASIPFEG